jgi:hypothetical protein
VGTCHLEEAFAGERGVGEIIYIPSDS